MMKCSRCGEEGAKKHRQNSDYLEKEKNYIVECDDCFKETEAYWDSQWEIYESLRG